MSVTGAGTGLTLAGYGWSVLSLSAALLSIAGYYLPIWLVGNLRNGDDVVEATFGPFRRCNYPVVNDEGVVQLMHQCGRYRTFDDIPSLWWKIVTVSTGIGCAMALLVAFISIPACVCRDIISRTSALVLGIVQVIAAIFIGIGCVIFPLGWDAKEVADVCGPKTGPYLIGSCTVGWAYYLVASGATLLLVCASLSTKAGRPVRWTRLQQTAGGGSGASNTTGMTSADERTAGRFTASHNGAQHYYDKV